MAEQHATANYLKQSIALNRYFTNFKAEIEERLTRIYEGFIKLKKDGYKVDAIAPQAAIYLTVQLNLAENKWRKNTY